MKDASKKESKVKKWPLSIKKKKKRKKKKKKIKNTWYFLSSCLEEIQILLNINEKILV